MSRGRRRGRQAGGTGKALPRTLLVFGEDDNDREAIRHLVAALRPDAPGFQKRRRPLVLVKGRQPQRARDSLDEIAKVVRADRCRFDVRGVIAHEDCDDVEPAHEELARSIEDGLARRDVRAIAATPAWETEAWWFLWPSAVAAVHAGWRRLARKGERVGLIHNAKEELRRSLRPLTGTKRGGTRDYQESDSARIAQQVREQGIVGSPDARSESWDRFARRVRQAVW